MEIPTLNSVWFFQLNIWFLNGYTCLIFSDYLFVFVRVCVFRKGREGWWQPCVPPPRVSLCVWFIGCFVGIRGFKKSNDLRTIGNIFLNLIWKSLFLGRHSVLLYSCLLEMTVTGSGHGVFVGYCCGHWSIGIVWMVNTRLVMVWIQRWIAPKTRSLFAADLV